MIDEWIYTECRKPDDGVMVLLCVIHYPRHVAPGLPKRTVGYYAEQADRYLAEDGYVYMPADVICWRSIPDIPLCVMEKYRDS